MCVQCDLPLQDSFSNPKTEHETPVSVVSRLIALAVELGISQNSFGAGFNNSYTDQATRISFKVSLDLQLFLMHCQYLDDLLFVRFFVSKACRPYVVTLLKWTSVFEWYMTRLVLQEWTPRRFGLCAQYLDTILGSMVWKAYVII